MADSVVRVETVELDASGSRQIAARRRATELLQDRRADIESAIAEATSIVETSAASDEQRGPWRIKTIEATFGLTLAAEAGVILSKASTEASFEVTITVERR